VVVPSATPGSCKSSGMLRKLTVVLDNWTERLNCVLCNSCNAVAHLYCTIRICITNIRAYSFIGIQHLENYNFLCMKQPHTSLEFSFSLLLEHLSIINSLVSLTIRLPPTTASNTSSQTTGHLNSTD